jgi:hypothetical protein
MRRRATVIVVALSLAPVASAAPWARVYDTANSEDPTCVIGLPDGGAFFAGTYDDRIAPLQSWWARTDQDGTLLWQHLTLAGERHEITCCVAVGDEFILAGHSESAGAWRRDGWVARVAQDGTLAWQQFIGGSEDDRFDGIAPLTDGGVVLIGQTLSFSAGDPDLDAWAVRLTSTGAIVWQQVLGHDTQGDGLLAVGVVSDDQIIAAGYTWSPTTATPDAWLLEFDGTGSVLSQRAIAGAGNELARSLVWSAAGDVIVAGTRSAMGGTVGQGWAVRVSATGLTWERGYEDGSQGAVEGIAEAADGALRIVGWTRDDAGTDDDAWLAILDADGSVRSSRRYGSPIGDRFLGLGSTPGSEWYVVGATAVVGMGTSGREAWLLRLEDSGSDSGCHEIGPAPLQVTGGTSSILDTTRPPRASAARAADTNIPLTGFGLVERFGCPPCALQERQPLGDAVACAGSLVVLDGSGLFLAYCTGGAAYTWRDELGNVVGTDPVLSLVASTTTALELTLACTNDPDCIAVRSVRVQVDGPPAFTAASARDIMNCNAGIAIEWAPATFTGSSRAGGYAIYRSRLSCDDALAGPPVAIVTGATSWMDATQPPGEAQHHVVEAENEDATSCSMPGPQYAGATTRICLAPVTDVASDDVPLDPGGLLRVRRDPAGLLLAWPALVLAPGEHVHVRAADTLASASFGLVSAEGDTSSQLRLPLGAASLRFFRRPRAHLERAGIVASVAALTPRRPAPAARARAWPTSEVGEPPGRATAW